MGLFTHLLTDTVTVKSQTGKSSSGDPVFGTASTIKARVEHKKDLVIGVSGVEQQANHKIVSESEILISDRLWLPGDDTTDDNLSRRIVAVGKASTPSGSTLYEAWL